jgi:DNA-binding transcriptional LysR family regulator
MFDTLPNIRHLIAFHEVVRCRRIRAAAEAVHLSQPAVTQAIAKLETQLATRLFERRPEGVFATETGEMFDRRVSRMLDFLEAGEMLAHAKCARQQTRGRRGFHRLATPVQLRALVAVSETGNYSQAARLAGISQPALHRAARDLETLAGLALFEPGRRGIELTPAAEALVHHVRLATAEIRQGFYEVAEQEGRDSTRIMVGSLPLSRTGILPAVIDELLHQKGRPQINCIDGPYASLLRGLRFGEIDFIIGAMRDPAPADDVVQEPLFMDRLSILARASHPLHAKANPTLDDALEYPWIAPPKNTPTGIFLFGILKIGERSDTPVRVVSSSLMLVRELMMRDDYLTIMSETQLATGLGDGVLKPLPIALEGNERPIGLTFRRDWHPTPTQARFLDMIRAFCVKLPGGGYNKIE